MPIDELGGVGGVGGSVGIKLLLAWRFVGIRLD